MRYIYSEEREEPTTKITLPSKAVIQIRQRNQKLYRQAEAKKIQHHQTSFATSSKGTSLSEKEETKTTIETRKLQLEKLTSKGTHAVKVGNHLHTI